MPRFMARSTAVLLLQGLSLASAGFVHLRDGKEAAYQLRVDDDKVVQTQVPCLPDLPGGPLMAGGTMAGAIALTAGVTVALLYYLVQKRQDALALPVAAGPSGPGVATQPTQDGSGVVKPTSQKKEKIYMYTLDGLRTILVTCVIFAHYPLGLPSICAHFLGWPMQFFFVLSGFVAQVQTESGPEHFTWLSGCTYVARRLARILPMYQLALVFQYALAVYGNRGCQPVAAWPINALLLQVFFPVQVCGKPDAAWTMGYTHFNGNGPAWFAACIVWFSCLFPLLYNVRPRAGVCWTFGVLVAILALRAAPDLVHPTWGTYGGGGPHLYAMSPVRLIEYTAGMWAAQFAFEICQKCSSWSCWCWVFDASLVILVAMIYFSLTVLQSTWTCSGDYHLTAICCFVCIAARLAASMPEESRQGLRGAVLHRAIGSTPLTYLARFSFAAYIFQTSFMSFTDGDQNFYLHRFCLLWIFSIFATIYMEEPIIAAVQARLKG